MALTSQKQPVKNQSACTFYHYHPIAKKQLPLLKERWLKKSSLALPIRGLILLSTEGVNGTLIGLKKDLNRFIKVMEDDIHIPIQSRWQPTSVWGFKALRVKIKKEIVKSGKHSLSIPPSHTHLTPAQWEQELKNHQSLLLDIRNDYEIQIGQFKGAKNLNLKQFKEFPNRLKKSNLPKEKSILIYCTGGIRCEKALSEMKHQGFKKVKQLKGGILNYLSQFPHSQFDGNCFVFDHRVSLDQTLMPSKSYQLCPHCGQPGNKHIQCQHCHASCVVCVCCYGQKSSYQTCSKNCAYHLQKGHRCKKKQNSSPNSLC